MLLPPPAGAAPCCEQEAVRNDHVEVVRLISSYSGKVMEEGQVISI